MRPGYKRRIEVFSPKLNRRLSMSSYAAWRAWLALKANPAVRSFCGKVGTTLVVATESINATIRAPVSTAPRLVLSSGMLEAL